MAILNDILETLRNAERMGQSKDEPEGVRYIQISDTLANELADRLEDHILMKKRPGYGYVRCVTCGVDMSDRIERFGLGARPTD